MNKYLFLVIPVLLTSCQNSDRENRVQFLRREIPKIEFAGIIENKYLDLQSQPMCILHGYSVPVRIENLKLYDQANIGDHFVKQKGTMKYLLIKRTTNDTIIFYPQIRFVDVKDSGNFPDIPNVKKDGRR